MNDSTVNKKNPSGESTSAGLLAPGTKLGKYRIDEMIGAGGMAVTYRGFDTMLARPVAIKQIASNLASNPKWCKQFRKEAQMVARLTDARNVVRIYELLSTREGLFLILEYVDGRSLEELIAEDKLGVQASLEIIWNVALGLRAIHGKGIIHRDIKPANILVPPNRKARIVDFGVAGGAGSSAGMGTTRYMAPELFAGSRADGRCDIYSLGMVGFEMLVGRQRFNELFADVLRDPDSQSLRWMKWHTSLDAELPPADRLNSDVPPLVAEMISRMTAKSCEARYGSVDEMIADMKERFAVPRGTLAAMASGGLRLPIDPTATTVLPDMVKMPPAPMSRFKKILLVSVLGVVLAAAGAGYYAYTIYQRNQLAAQHNTAGQTAFDRAAESKEPAKEYAEAVAAWLETVRVDPRGRTEAGRHAQQMLPLAQAWVGMLRLDWTEADNRLLDAERRGSPLTLVRQMRTRLDTDRRVHGALLKIDGALGTSQFELADQTLRDLATALPEYAGIATQQQRIEKARRTAVYNKHVVDGRQKMTEGKYDDAREAYLSAQRALLPQDDAMLREIQGFLADVDSRQRYEQALREAREAEAAKKYDVAADRYDEARKLRPNKNLDQLHDQMLVRAALAEAGRLRSEGKVRAAYDAYQNALTVDPNNEDALREVEALRRIDDWEPKVKEADEAFGQSKYTEALTAYKDAAALIPTRYIEERIRLCEFGRLMAEGDAALERKDWTAAETSYRDASQHGSQADVDRKLELMRIEKDYAAAVEEGDAALQAEDYRKATQAYEKARKLKPGPQIDESMRNLEYRRNLSSGDKAMTSKNYSGALMYYRKARNVKDTEEIRRKIEMAQSHITPGG